MGETTIRKYPFAGRTKPMIADHAEALLNRTWRPALSVTGADGFPAIADAGNVLRPRTSLKLSLRLPPPVDGARRHAGDASACSRPIRPTAPRCDSKATKARPDGTRRRPRRGWQRALDDASQAFYGKPAAAMGEGGTIPFMAMLGKHFPEAQFLITGVLGPKSNAHGPNEFLHVPYAKKLTACVADGARRPRGAHGLATLTQMPWSFPGFGVGGAGQRKHVVLSARERADQEARDVGIERRTRRRLEEPAELAVVARGAEPAPVADHVHVRAFAEQRPLADGGESGERPARNGMSGERLAQALVVRFGGFGADARAGAAAALGGRKQGPDRFSSPSDFQHSACSDASERSVSRAWRFDANGPYAPARSPGSIRGGGNEASAVRAVAGNMSTPASALRRSARLCAGSIDLTSVASRSSAPSSPAVSSNSMRRISAERRRSVSLNDSRKKNARRRARAGSCSCRCTAAAR